MEVEILYAGRVYDGYLTSLGILVPDVGMLPFIGYTQIQDLTPGKMKIMGRQ